MDDRTWVALVSPNAPHDHRRGASFDNAVDAAKYIVHVISHEWDHTRRRVTSDLRIQQVGVLFVEATAKTQADRRRPADRSPVIAA